MATIKKSTVKKSVVPKAQLGKKVGVKKSTPMLDYVNKYKGKGGLSDTYNVANDTLGGNSPRDEYYNGGFGGTRSKQIDDLQTAHDKKFGKNSTIDERKNGGKVAKKKMKNGGSLSGLKASNKRVGPVDPNGAFTKVQKKTLAGAKGKASLTKDKQLGATKMAKCGTKMSKKK